MLDFIRKDNEILKWGSQGSNIETLKKGLLKTDRKTGGITVKAKMILTAAVLAALAGGYQGFAEDAGDAKYVDVSGTEMQLTDADLAKEDYDLSIKNSYYTGTTPDAALTVTEDPNTATSGGVVLADGTHSNKTFRNLNSFTVQQTDSEKFYKRSSSGVIVGSSGGTITFDHVKNINLGSADNVLNNGDMGPVIHGFSGSVSISGADNLNIYADRDGITGQQSNASKTEGSVNISAQNIMMQIGGTGVSSAVYADKDHVNMNATTSVVLNAADSISIKNTGALGTVAQIADNYGSTIGAGNATLTIHAGNDINLIGTEPASWGVIISRSGAGRSELEIKSDNGDVNIEGGEYGLRASASNGESSPIAGLISGKTVTVKGTTGSSTPDNGIGAGILLSGAKGTAEIDGEEINGLTLRGDTINVSGTTALYAKNGSVLNLQGTGSSSVINLTSTAENGNAINAAGGSQITIGDAAHTADVNINGYIKVTGTGSQLTFAGNTTVHVNSQYLTNENHYFITTDKTQPVNGIAMLDEPQQAVVFEEGAKLDIGNVAAGTTLYFSDDQAVSQEAAQAIKTDNVLQEFKLEGGKLVAVAVSKEDAAQLLGGSLLTNVALAATGDEKYADVKALVDGDNAKEALDSAAGLAAMANTAHGTYTMNGIFSDAVSGHLMNRQDQDVWAYGFHSKENVNGLSFGADYDAQYNGIAAGADFYKKGGTTAGLALIYADSNVSGSNGFATTKNDADYYGVSLYSRFDRGSYALLGDISYMKGDHDVTQMNKGQIITASPDSDSISVGVKAVKDYAAGENGTLTPYVGLRYLRLSTDDFTASNGLRYEGDDQDLVIVPVGVNYTAAISHGKWSVRPYAGIGYVWTAGDRSADQTVMVGGVADSFSYDTADSGSFIARAGVTTDCGDMSYGIGYSWQKGDSVSNNAWTLSASYHF